MISGDCKSTIDQENDLQETLQVIPGEVGTLYQRIKAVQRYDESVEDFFLPSGWEVLYDSAILKVIKEDLIQQTRRMADGWWYRARWRYGMFDSVSQYFVIGKIWLYAWDIPGPKSDLPFIISGGKFDEDASPTTAHDLTLIDILEPRWNEKYVAWRDKLDGTPVYADHDKMRSCGFTGKRGRVSSAEWDSAGLHVLYPYILTVQWSGLTWNQHEWKSLDTYRPHAAEGVVLLSVEGMEYRLRDRPSVEVTLPGMHDPWEIEMNEKGEILHVRPRPGKLPGLVRDLNSQVKLRDLKWPAEGLKIHMVYDGPIQNITVTSRVVYVDSCYREESNLTRKVCGDVINEMRGNAIVVYPSATVSETGVPIVGSKGVVVTKDRKVYLFKDKDKHYDFIGGKIEPGESSLEALKREISEETSEFGDYKLLEADYLGLSYGNGYASFLYLLPEDILKYGKWAEWTPSLKVMPWINPYMLHLNSSISYNDGKILCRPFDHRRAEFLSLTKSGKDLVERIDDWKHERKRIVPGAISPTVPRQLFFLLGVWKDYWAHALQLLSILYGREYTTYARLWQIWDRSYIENHWIPLTDIEKSSVLRLCGKRINGVYDDFDFLNSVKAFECTPAQYMDTVGAQLKRKR